MYAKAIIPPDHPGDVSSPMLLVTTPSGSTLAADLHLQGWHPYGGHLEEADGEVGIEPAGELVVVIGGRVALRDSTNPVSPPGWWEAVDRLSGRCVVVLLPATTPISDPSFGDLLLGLRDDPGTAQALLRVAHTDPV